MNKATKIILILVGLLILLVALGNVGTLTIPVSNELSEDPRNEAVDVSVHYKAYVNPAVLVFTVKDNRGSRVDAMRTLLQSAEILQDRRFGRVELHGPGGYRYYLEGDYFQELGEDNDFQNPAYTMRTFTEHVYEPGGSKAFYQFNTSLLGSMTEGLSNLNEMHDVWYINDL